MRQPLAAIAASGGAALNWLNNKAPNLDQVRVALQRIVSQSHRADAVIKNVRALFKEDPTPKVRLNINELIEQVTTLVKQDTIVHKIVLETDADTDTGGSRKSY
jgi:nitrogen-specific signal transduction histidine kinase